MRAQPAAGSSPRGLIRAEGPKRRAGPGRTARLARAAVLPGAFLLVLLLAACGGGGPSSDGPSVDFPDAWPYAEAPDPVAARRGMVVTADSLATAVGLEVLRAGGNAADAAVAVHFALAVTYPQAGNVGGGGFLVLRTPEGATAALDFREEAPGAASPDMYLDPTGKVTRESRRGHLASGVPGSVAGMAELHRRYGSLAWERLLDPAIRLAADGFVVDERLHGDLAGARERLARFASTAGVLLRDGRPPAVGTRLRQPELARTLEAIAEEGPRAFYEGWIADSLVAEMERGGGIIDREDLASYRAVWREPIVARYRDRRVISMPPPSSGGVTLAEMLRIVEGIDLAAMGWASADAIHVLVEAMRRAYADRNFYLGDPDFVDVPLERLLSRSYADSLRATIRMERASRSDRFGRVPAESRQTTHFSVVDSAGTAVALSTTINSFFGSGVLVRGAGFLLNNEMDDFTAKPGVPNIYGLVQGEANAIRPGKRMLSSMSPTIVVGPDGRTELVTGTPGGATIITTVLQQVVNLVDFGLPVETSVHAPRVHHQHLPDILRYERNGLPPGVVAELRDRGHRVRERDGISGNVSAISLREDGLRLGMSDPRRGGSALGH